MKYKTFIGLEVHVELNTKSKMFCRCSANYFGQKPNSHTCPVCLGLPGALPVPNKTAIEWCMKIGIALNSKIALYSKFDRKNYFYPDLAKGYQISQYDKPFCENGFININNKNIRIKRVHMEEDTGKLTHATVKDKKVSLIDFNRSGVPLVEIVTEPDFESAEEVVLYLKKLQQIVRYLGVSNADMEKGEMRLEPNISLSKNNDLPGYKVEVKNINSFKFVEKAIRYETTRHKDMLDEDTIPVQETRGWDENKQKTFSQRVKEEANDYRYFPEPDIPPFQFEKQYIDKLKTSLPELPYTKLERFINKYKLSEYNAEILTRDVKLADYFEAALVYSLKMDLNVKDIANYIINKKVNYNEIEPKNLIQMILNTKQKNSMDDNEIEKIINKVIENNPKAVTDFKNGNTNVIGFLIGQVKKESGNIETGFIRMLIEKKLNE